MVSRIMHCIVLCIILAVNTVYGNGYVPDRIIVKFQPAIADRIFSESATGVPEIDALLQELDIRTFRRLAPQRSSGPNAELREYYGTDGILIFTYSSQIDPLTACSELREIPEIAYAHPDYYAELCVIPDDPLYVHQYAMPLMRMPEAWDVGIGDERIVIGISDTGTDWDHPDLIDNIWINTTEDINGNGEFDNFPSTMGGDLDDIDTDGNGYIDDVVGWDFVTAEEVAEGEDGFPPDPDPMDFDGHGTATAGIASAVTDNQSMVAGTGWNCSIMPLKTFYGTSSGNATAVGSDIVESFYYATDNGVRILSMSFRSVHTDLLQEAVEYANAAGVFLVASAGNETSEIAPAPAMYPEVLAVAATQQQDVKASFSNFGPWVGVSAPGVDIWTTAFDDSYMADFGGTSASCPYVAGVAGLLRSLNPSLSPREVYLQLVGTADEIDSVNPEFRGDLGCGRLNGLRALTDEPHPSLRLSAVGVDDSSGGNGDGLLGPGETANLILTVRNYWITATDVTGYLYTSDPSVSVDSTVAIHFGSVETDSFATSTGDASVIIEPDAEVGYQVLFELRLETASGHTEKLEFYVPMAAEMFADVSLEWGLLPASGSLTVAFADIDDDGDTDLYRSAWNTDYGLYRNDGNEFVNITEEWGVSSPGNGQGAAFGDYDNDGDPDLVHGTSEGIALYRNDGIGTGFVNVTAGSGLTTDTPQKFAPLWGDYDNDGDLDLFIAHQQQQNLLYRNNDDGTFTEVGETAGVASDSISFSASWSDFDRDGDLDLFVANFGSPWEGQFNQFYINQGAGVFVESAEVLGLAEEALISTGGFWADYDGDGWLDLYVTNRGYAGQPNRLYRNIRGKGFIRSSCKTVEDPLSSTCASWGDFDGDGLIDLYVCNSQRSSLYRNLGNETFGNATDSAPFIEVASISTWTDIDGDGDEDLFVGAASNDYMLLNLNDPQEALHIKLRGAPDEWGGCRDGLHSRVTVTNGITSVTRVVGEGSAMSQAGHILTFPRLSGNPEILVEWSRGTMQRIDPGLDDYLTIEEERPDNDFALRAIALPMEISRGEARIKAEVSVQNNGSGSAMDCAVWLEVADETGIVFDDSIHTGGASSSILQFHDVPAPQNGEQYTYIFRIVADGDQLMWNNMLYQTLSGEEPRESFEFPAVEWYATEEWAWKYEDPVYRPYSGERMMIILPGGNDSPHLRSPKYAGYMGTIMSLRFMNYYELGQDSISVCVWQDTLLLGRLVLQGSQESYVQESIDFQVDSDEDVYLEWHCVRPDGSESGWHYVLDDVEFIVIMDGLEPDPKPFGLTISGPWPNPSRGSLIWKIVHSGSAGGHVDIYDLAGRCIRKEPFRVNGRGTSLFMMDANRLPPGAYIARFALTNESIKRLFVRVN